MAVVLNTRPADQNAGLSALLRAAGFEPLEIPLVDIVPDVEGLERLRRTQPNGFTGVFLSSPNGLRLLAAELLPMDLEAWTSKPFYLVGPKAAALVGELGGKVAFHPETASLEGFLAEYSPAAERGRKGVAGLVLARRWLHPCSASTRLDPAAFRGKGIEIENIPVYRPGRNPRAPALLARDAGAIEAAIFCSGSAVANFFDDAPPGLAGRLGKMDGILAVSIGPSTTQALAEKGVTGVLEAAHADDSSLVDALKQAYGSRTTRVLPREAKAGPGKKPSSPASATPEPQAGGNPGTKADPAHGGKTEARPEETERKP
jgi:uroporphyrinogen-III synthase